MTIVATYGARNGQNTLDTLYYNTIDGTVIEEREGGTIAWDNFNPGNITYATSGPGSAIALGAIGEYIGSNGFDYDIFPSYTVGFDAVETLLESSLYEGAGDTIDTAITHWSGDTGSALTNYEATVTAAVGLPGWTLLSSLNLTQFGGMASGIETQEGYTSGTDYLAPTATANNQTKPAGTVIPLSMLFNYSAVSGDSVVGFAVKEITNNGYLTENGVRQSSGIVYGNTPTGIPIGDISEWAFVAGPSGTSDQIAFNAIEGQDDLYNPAVTATITSTESSPPPPASPPPPSPPPASPPPPPPPPPPASPPPASPPPASGHLTIDLTPDNSVIQEFGSNYQSSSFWTEVIQAAEFFENTFSNPITINIDIGWGEINGQTVSDGGESERTLSEYGFNTIINALDEDATSPSDLTAIANLPTQDPGSGGDDFSIADAEAKALGLTLNGGNLSTDGYIGLATDLAPSDASFVGVVEHEISEVMGRVSGINPKTGVFDGEYSILDLFRYFGGPPLIPEPSSSMGPNGEGTTYFSIDGGLTQLNTFSDTAGQDPGGDWASTNNDAFDALYNPGQAGTVSANDIVEMNVLGYQLASSPPPPASPPPPPTSPPPPPASPPSPPPASPPPPPGAMVLNDASMFAANELNLVNAFVGNGGTVSYYSEIMAGGFTLSNPDRTDFAFTSIDSGFAAAVGDFYDGPHILAIPDGGSTAVDALNIARSDGSAFSIGSVQLDTVLNESGVSVTASATTQSGVSVSETFDLDDTHGLQTFGFNTPFDDIVSLTLSPSDEVQFDNLTFGPATSPPPASPPPPAGPPPPPPASPPPASPPPASPPPPSSPPASPPPPPIAPTVNVQNILVAENTPIAASSMITSVSNPSGDSITAYEFIDEGGGGGHFSVNGVAQLDNERIEVLTNNLSTIEYVGGSSPGADTLEVGVYDYSTNSYSAYSALTATTTVPNVPPSGLALAPASDSGVKGDNITNVTTPTITGDGVAGDSIDLDDGSTLVGTGTVAANGTWAVVTTALAPGPHSLTATQNDANDNISPASSALALTIVSPDLSVLDTGTGQVVGAIDTLYSGPVTGLNEEYIYTGSENLNVSVTSDDWFIHTGSGEDAIAVLGGTNVLDGGTGSNFLTGGSGTDTFFVDDRSPPSDIWSTVNGFHEGDAATVFGVTPTNASFDWVDNQGASGYTGLTLHATEAGRPTASLTLPGYSTSDLSNGTLSLSFGSEADGTPYLYLVDNL